MFHPDSPDSDHFEQVLSLSVLRIFDTVNSSDYLAWAQATFPGLLGLDTEQLDFTEYQRLINLLATAIWKATPHPANEFRPLPIEAPLPNAPCFCGSGRRYRDCCGDLDGMPDLSTELMWEFLLDELSEEQVRDALALDAVPLTLFPRIAEHWLDEERPKRAVQLLEPLFGEALDQLSPLHGEEGLDVLCDAYDRLGHWRKKHTLLERLCAEGSIPLQVAAWQRRCTICIDEGDYEGADTAFQAALRGNPDDPATAMLEITLLVTRHRTHIARERARFWLQRFRRLGIEEDAVLHFFEHASLNPEEALLDTHADILDPALIDLHDWVEVIGSRALPDYALIPPHKAQRSRTHPDVHPLLPAAEVSAPPVVQFMEQHWRALFPGEKPQSIELNGYTETVWTQAQWLDYLLAHPELADSLEVLDDLSAALHEHPESALPWITQALLRPLIERATAILEQALAGHRTCILPWSNPRNRIALRLLFRRYLYQIQGDLHEDAKRTLEMLLRLNPQDNHGVRAELMNHYLRDGEDEQALALAQRFPNDLLADLAYGEVLALYRLGRQERARLVLGAAMHRLPRIPDYLTRERIKRPRIDPRGMTPGGDDQAWLYREAMRDVWAAEPGILAWLKRLTA